MSFTSILAAFTSGPLSWITVLVVIVLFGLFGMLMHRLAGYLGEHTQGSQAARVVNMLGSIADGIAETLLAHPPAAPNILAAVRAAGVAQGVAYAKAAMPDTVKALGMSDEVIAARLDREVSGVLNGSAAPSLAAMAVVQQTMTSAVQNAVTALLPAAPTAPSASVSSTAPDALAAPAA